MMEGRCAVPAPLICLFHDLQFFEASGQVGFQWQWCSRARSVRCRPTKYVMASYPELASWSALVTVASVVVSLIQCGLAPAMGRLSGWWIGSGRTPRPVLFLARIIRNTVSNACPCKSNSIHAVRVGSAPPFLDYPLRRWASGAKNLIHLSIATVLAAGMMVLWNIMSPCGVQRTVRGSCCSHTRTCPQIWASWLPFGDTRVAGLRLVRAVIACSLVYVGFPAVAMGSPQSGWMAVDPDVVETTSAEPRCLRSVALVPLPETVRIRCRTLLNHCRSESIGSGQILA